MMMPIDFAILEKTTFMRGFHKRCMDDDPKKLSMFSSLYGTIINTDGEIIRIDLLSRRMKYNKFILKRTESI